MADECPKCGEYLCGSIGIHQSSRCRIRELERQLSLYLDRIDARDLEIADAAGREQELRRQLAAAQAQASYQVAARWRDRCEAAERKLAEQSTAAAGTQDGFSSPAPAQSHDGQPPPTQRTSGGSQPCVECGRPIFSYPCSFCGHKAFAVEGESDGQV